MYEQHSNETTFEFTISSRMKLVDTVVDELSIFFEEELKISQYEKAIVVLRELLCNSIEHGNNKDSHKTVKGKIETLSQYRIKITISDEGCGFDKGDISIQNNATNTEGRSLGFSLIHNLSDGYEIVPEEKSVIVYMSLLPSTEFIVEEGGELCKIIPTGDISASVDEAFRECLLNWLNSDVKKCSLDFSSVKTVDSICLSVLISVYKLINESYDGYTLEFENVSPMIKELLRLTQLDRYFTIRTDCNSSITA